MIERVEFGPMPVLQKWKMMVIYTDDCIMACKDSNQIDMAIPEISARFDITDEGEVKWLSRSEGWAQDK